MVVVSVAMAFVVVLRDLLPFVLWTKRTDSFNQLHVRLASLISPSCLVLSSFICFVSCLVFFRKMTWTTTTVTSR